MKFFIDTANLDEIREAEAWGILAGVTTNPSLYAKTGGKLGQSQLGVEIYLVLLETLLKAQLKLRHRLDSCQQRRVGSYIGIFIIYNG